MELTVNNLINRLQWYKEYFEKSYNKSMASDYMRDSAITYLERGRVKAINNILSDLNFFQENKWSDIMTEHDAVDFILSRIKEEDKNFIDSYNEVSNPNSNKCIDRMSGEEWYNHGGRSVSQMVLLEFPTQNEINSKIMNKKRKQLYLDKAYNAGFLEAYKWFRKGLLEDNTPEYIKTQFNLWVMEN